MKIHISVLFVLIFALYTGTFIEFGIFFGCIILHEIGHLFFIVLFKQKVNGINITIFGGQLDCYINNVSFIKNFLINTGGIIMNLIILYFSKNVDGYYKDVIINYNKLLIVFNCLPIYPLDGYRIFETLLFNIDFKYSFFIQTVISIFIITLIFIYGIIISSIGLCLISIILLLKNIKRLKEKDDIFLRKYIRKYI